MSPASPTPLVVSRAIAFAALAAACAKPEPPPPPEEPTAERLAIAVAAALQEGAAERVASTMGSASVRVDIRQRLSETDERASTDAADRAALTAWIDLHARQWRCDGGPCRWRRGLVTEGRWTCAGDCCTTPRRPMVAETLYLTRVCFAAREGKSRKLTYLDFTEVR